MLFYPTVFQEETEWTVEEVTFRVDDAFRAAGCYGDEEGVAIITGIFRELPDHDWRAEIDEGVSCGYAHPDFVASLIRDGEFLPVGVSGPLRVRERQEEAKTLRLETEDDFAGMDIDEIPF